jgi:hypothetical protein
MDERKIAQRIGVVLWTVVGVASVGSLLYLWLGGQAEANRSSGSGDAVVATRSSATPDSDEYTSEGAPQPAAKRNPLAAIVPSGSVVEWREGFPICPKCKQLVAFEATGCRGGHEFAWATQPCDLCDGTGRAPCTKHTAEVATDIRRLEVTGLASWADVCEGTGRFPDDCPNCDGGIIRGDKAKGSKTWRYGEGYHFGRPKGFAAVKPTKLIRDESKVWLDGRTSLIFDCPICPVDGAPNGRVWGTHKSCRGTGRVKCPRCLGIGELGKTSPYD